MLVFHSKSWTTLRSLLIVLNIQTVAPTPTLQPMRNYSDPALRSPFAHARRIFFLIFPVLVLGSSSTISTSFGTMKRLMAGCSLHHLMKFSWVIFLPCLTVMNALGHSPHFSSDMAATPHSRMSGCVTMTDSRATEEMFSPP